MRGALLVAGTTSDAGKSTVTAGLARLLARRGVRVAPFKAQNMSNNSVATVEPDGTSGEIGRAQATQALACGLAPSVRFNPVLLKPGSDRQSQLVLHGRAVAQVGARDYLKHRSWLRAEVAKTLESLRAEFDVVLCEGAGSPAEINLRASDIANLGLAEAADLAVLLVGDIDRGGVLAHLAGTVAVLAPADQQRIYGYVINKFRGDEDILTPGLDALFAMTGRATYGVLPYLPDLWLDAEDSLTALGRQFIGPAPASGQRDQPQISVAAIAFPRVSNTTDLEALACEPAVSVQWTSRPDEVASADLVVLPGTKTTVSDLAWLRERGLADAITARAAAGKAILGICGGYQMLADRITDPLGVEAAPATQVAGLGLLDQDVEFAPTKCVRTVTGAGLGVTASGYEIHHGRVLRSTEPALLDGPAGPDGAARVARSGALQVVGTHWHGLLGGDEFRRAYLSRTFPRAVLGPPVSYEHARMAQLDRIADAIETHCDVDAILAPLTQRRRSPGTFSTILPTLKIVSD